jgi:hypothetical protein
MEIYDFSSYTLAELEQLASDMQDQTALFRSILKLTRKDKAQIASNEDMLAQIASEIAKR